MDNLKENDYRDMFINCVSVTFEEPESEPTANTEPVATDGFDWDKNMLDAYRQL